MIENQQNSNTELPLRSDKQKSREDEIDLIEIFHKVIGIRKTIYKAAGVGLVIGIIVALSIPKQYTVKVTLSPEMGSSKGTNGLAGLASSFLGNGAAMGESSDALNASLSSDIVSSTPFLLELFEMKVDFFAKGDSTTFETYLDKQSSPWWSYIVGMPGLIIRGAKSLFSSENKIVTTDKIKQTTIVLTKKQADKISLLKKTITASIDAKTAITSISVTLQNPNVAAVVADSVVHKLQQYIINYRTSKAKEDCAYLEKLFVERQQEYYIAQKKYANYVDSHDNLILQSVRAEQERLQNDASLAYQVYSQVANQLQVSRAKVQEEKPVFAVLEPAVVPQQPSGIGLKIYALLFMFLAVVCTIGWKLMGQGIWSSLKKQTKIEKVI